MWCFVLLRDCKTPCLTRPLPLCISVASISAVKLNGRTLNTGSQPIDVVSRASRRCVELSLFTYFGVFLLSHPLSLTSFSHCLLPLPAGHYVSQQDLASAVLELEKLGSKHAMAVVKQWLGRARDRAVTDQALRALRAWEEHQRASLARP